MWAKAHPASPLTASLQMSDDILYKVAGTARCSIGFHFVEDQKSEKYLARGMILL